ncbi:MAG: hypothetical protein HZA79_11005 [Sphingobacteriales bacterium]|nr:hypothetical protein [Sphingobacteriales bacterium]
MIPEDESLQRWQHLENLIAAKTGQAPGLNDILLYIGVLESGMPPRALTENEKNELIEMAICTVLVPARYYELFWVEDTGWPHYKQLQRLPPMNPADRNEFLKKYILLYAAKNRWV